MNTREISRGGHTFTITRRFLPVRPDGSRPVRIRVTARKGSSGPVVQSEYRDYRDMHEADAVFSRHIKAFESI
jgi:hypothetical protein